MENLDKLVETFQNECDFYFSAYLKQFLIISALIDIRLVDGRVLFKKGNLYRITDDGELFTLKIETEIGEKTISRFYLFNFLKFFNVVKTERKKVKEKDKWKKNISI